MNISNSHRLSIAVLCCLLFAGGAAFAQKITFTPQWTAQAQFAGYYVAQEMGFYKDAGLEVEIVHPTVSQTAFNLIRSGQSQLTTIQLCQAMELINDGVPLVNVLQTSMNNALVIVSKEDRNPLEQKGIRVGTWSAGFDQIAICMALKERLDYKWFRAASSINLFVAGAFDATLAMSYNEYYLLKQSGVKLTDRNVYRFCDHDYNVQEDGVYTTRGYFETHRDEVLRFAEASKRGWLWAAEHPEETLDIVMKYVKRDNIATNRTLQKLMLEEILRLQVDRESGQREFRLKPEMVELANRLMLDNQILLNEVTYEQLTAH